MPRERRIEYKDAIYHVLARGDRREDIVVDDKDRDRFEETLEEVVGKSGWVLFAWVLMSNHYHFVFKTPEANLVDGMSWFQGTWTKRFNARHRLWGHLFGGRYKAIPVEDGDYLTRLIHYVHLNPVRAGLVKKEQGIEGYRWCSLADYMKPKRSRRKWIGVERGLTHVELPDTAAGRRRFLEWTEGLIDWNSPHEAGNRLADGQTLNSTLRRGWYFGGERFREDLLKKLAKLKPGAPGDNRRKGYSARQVRDHGQKEAERIIEVAAVLFDLAEDGWNSLPKGDWRKGLVAGSIRERSLVPNAWVAAQLRMGATGAVSRTIREARELAARDRKVRCLARELAKDVQSF